MAADKPDSFVMSMIENMRASGAQVAQVTFRDKADKPIITVLIVDAPDETQMIDLTTLQERWNDGA